MAGYPTPTGDQAWIYKSINNFLGGVDFSKRPDELGDTQCSQLVNVIAKQGALINDTGYKPFLTTPLVGTPQREYDWQQPDGSITTMLVTTKTVYQYAVTGPQWRLIRGTAATTATFDSSPGTILLIVGAVGGFSTGDLIGIDLPNGMQHQTTITNINGLVFTLAVATPSAVSAGAAVVRAVALNGDPDHAVVADTYAANNWFVFTNGVDTPKRFDTTSCVDLPNLPSGGATVCQSLCVYNASVFLFNTTEGGTTFPVRARRSDIGDPTNWSTGLAGKDDLLDKSDPIVTAKRLGPYLIVYRDHSIARGQFIGAGGVNYQFDTMIDQEGLLSAYAVSEIVTDRDNFHVFVGKAGAYRYNGDFTILPISDAIFEKVWGSNGNMGPTRRKRTWTVYVKELKELWVGYASVQADFPDIVWRYSFTYKIWYQRLFADTFLSAESFEQVTDFLWTDLVGTWLDQSGSWESMVSSGRSTKIHLVSSSGIVQSYDYITTLDNGVAIQYIVETKDFLSQDAVLRFDLLEAYIQAGGTEVHYSTDQGKSWSTLGTISRFPEGRARLYKQFVGQRLRFRFIGTDTNFLLEWVGLNYKLESLYDLDSDSGM